MSAAALFSCTKEEPIQPGTEDIPAGYEVVDFSVVSEKTKTDIDDAGNTIWTKGDKITLLWNGGSGSATLKGDGGSAEGTFSGAVPGDENVFYAVYPSSLTSSLSGSTVNVTFPAVQNGSFAAGNMSVSKVNDDRELYFSNINAFFKIQLKSDEITKITIESLNGSPLVGTLPVTPGESGVSLGEPTSTSSTVEMTGGAKGRYYISVLPGVTHARGLLLKYYKGEDVSGTYFLDKSVTTVRNKVLSFGEFEPDGNYYVTLTGAGNKNGVDWANAMTPAQMAKLITVNGEESGTARAARIAAINGATFHLGAGEHNLGDNQTVSFTGEAEPVELNFIGGYAAAGSESRDVENNLSAFSGAGAHAALILDGNVTASFDGVGFVNGKVSANEKGALECAGSSTSVTLTNCFVKNNTNTSVDGAGAGIQLTGCGSFTATDCTISGNTAYASPAMYIRNTSVNMTGCTFDNNIASNNTGAFRITGGNTSTFTECTFSNNRANGGDRGAVNHNAGTSTFTDCTFSGNYASGKGGAIATTGTGTLKVIGGSISDNSAGEKGGALYIVGASAQFTEVEISGNTAASAGAGVVNTTSNFTRCTISGNSANWGGALRCESGNLQIQGGTISGNHAKGGGAIHIPGGSGSLAIVASREIGTVISNNYATSGHGGAIMLENEGTWSIEDAVFEGNYNNSSSAAWGGTIGTTGDGTLNITGCTFNGNHSKYLGGAAVNLQASSNMNMENCTFTGNYSECSGIADGNNNGNYGGGAMRLNTGGTVNITNCRFKENYVKKSSSYNHAYGGAVYVNTGGTFRFDRCYFDGNSATRGGALCSWATGAKIYMNACSFTDNWISFRYGTTIHIEKAGEFCMNNCSIADNTYTTGGTGDWQACWLNLSTLDKICISNCSFIGSPRTGTGKTIGTAKNAIVRFDALTTNNNYFINDIIVTEGTATVNKSLANYNKAVTMNNLKRSDNSANGAGGSATPVESPASNGFAATNAYFGDLEWQAGAGVNDSYWYWNGNMLQGNNKMRLSAAQVKSAISSANSAFSAWLDEIEATGFDQCGNYRGTGEWWPGAYQPNGEELRFTIATFNLRSSDMDENRSYPERFWKNRKVGVASWFNTNSFPVVSTQECTPAQRDYILSNCPDYSCVQYTTSSVWPWADDDMAPVAIFYKPSEITVNSYGTFWLVDGAPTIPSKTSVQKHSRCVTWMRCTYKGEKMLVMDTHLSYSTVNTDVQDSQEMQELREYEMAVICKWIEDNYNKTSDGPMMLMGDFNIDQGNVIFDRFKKSGTGDLGRYARDHSKGWTCFGRTYNAWGNVGLQGTIDHQFHNGFSRVKDYLIDNCTGDSSIGSHPWAAPHTYAGVTYLSDHWPVVVTYAF